MIKKLVLKLLGLKSKSMNVYKNLKKMLNIEKTLNLNKSKSFSKALEKICHQSIHLTNHN